jgi:hypothetical protein
VHEQHTEAEDRAAHTGAAQLAHMDVAMGEKPARAEQERDPDGEADDDRAGVTLVERWNEQADDRRHAHQPDGRAP